MEWRPSNWEDIRKYYGETYIKIPDTGEQLWFVVSVASDSVILRSTLPGKEESLLELHEDQPYVVDMVLPHKSTFQFNDNAYFMERVPAQQYRRGISSSNCKLYQLRDTGSWQQVSLKDEILNAYVNKQSFLPIGAGVKYSSIALAPRWSMSRNGYIFVDMLQAGSINFETKQHNVTSLVRPEFEKLLKIHGEYGTYRVQ